MPFCGEELFFELLWREAVDEGFHAIDSNHGNVVLIFYEQLVIRFDVDFLKCKLIVAACLLDCGFGLVAEVAAGSRINNYMRFGQLTTPSA